IIITSASTPTLFPYTTLFRSCPFGRPHCTATSIGYRIPGIELQHLEILDLSGVIVPRFKVALPLLQSTGSLHLRGATTAKQEQQDRKSTRLNSSHRTTSYAVF